MVGGLSDVSGVDEVVIRVAELAVALLEARQEVVQRLRVYLSRHTKQSSMHTRPVMLIHTIAGGGPSTSHEGRGSCPDVSVPAISLKYTKMYGC